VHHGILADRLEQRFLIDFAVDRDGHAIFEMRRQIGKLLAEFGEQLPYVGSVDIEFANATGKLAQISDECHMSHYRELLKSENAPA
jgi:hypothetical protein